jgi:hypothetical protein
VTADAPNTAEEAMSLWGDLLERCGGRRHIAASAGRAQGWGEPPTAEGQAHHADEEGLTWAIIRELRARGCKAYHADAGSKAGPRNNKAKAGRPPVGWPDVPVYLPGGRHALIEVKLPGEYPTEEQEAMHEELRSLGFDVIVARSVHEALTGLGFSGSRP